MPRPDDVVPSATGTLLAPNVLLYVLATGAVHVVVMSVADGSQLASGYDTGPLASEGVPDLLKVSLDELLRTRLAPMDASTRQLVCDAACDAVAEMSVSDQLVLGPTLHTLRDALRERLPVYQNVNRTESGFAVNKILRIDVGEVYMSGWRQGSLSLTAVSPEGERVPLALTGEAAFATVLELRIASPGSQGWVVEARSADASPIGELRARVVESADLVCDSLVSDVAADGVPLDMGHCATAIDRVRAALRRRMRVEAVDVHGAPPSRPQLTVVVPLRNDPASVEHQLAQLVLEPDAHEIELIYVFSSDGDQASARREFSELFELYDVPFRVVAVQPAVPYAIAVNVAVAMARSPLLVVVEPWVLPVMEGWLDDLIGCGTSVKGIGLFAPVDTPAGTACIAVNREWFLAAGGMQGVYLYPDTEVVELCRRASSQGKIRQLSPRGDVVVAVGEPRSARNGRAYDAWRFNRDPQLFVHGGC